MFSGVLPPAFKGRPIAPASAQKEGVVSNEWRAAPSACTSGKHNDTWLSGYFESEKSPLLR